jgi:hypothetical protein
MSDYGEGSGDVSSLLTLAITAVTIEPKIKLVIHEAGCSALMPGVVHDAVLIGLYRLTVSLLFSDSKVNTGRWGSSPIYQGPLQYVVVQRDCHPLVTHP